MYVLELPWLLLLLPLPWLLRYVLPARHCRQDAVRTPFFQQMAEATGQRPGRTATQRPVGFLAHLLNGLAWCLLVLALAAPTRLEPPIEKLQPQRDLLLAIDTSQSMETTDTGAGLSRMQAVQQVMGTFIERRRNDRLGLVIFGDRPYTQAGFTQDQSTLRTLLGELQPGIAGPRTALGDAIGLGVKQFASSAAQDKVLILLSDGRDTASRMPPEQAALIARQHGIRLYCIGFGSTEGEGENRLDEALLQRIAHDSGGRYLHASDQQELALAIDELDRLLPVMQRHLQHQPASPLYVYPLGTALGLLLLGWLANWHGVRTRAGA